MKISLKTYLKKLNYIYIRINPLFNYQIYNSDFILKEKNSENINFITGSFYIYGNVINKIKNVEVEKI